MLKYFVLTAIFCIFVKSCNMADFNKVDRYYQGDQWERQYMLHNGVFDKINPSGNMIEDFADFLFGQGGGKSCDPHDTASGSLPPIPDIDGIKYHTVHDITWKLYSDPVIYKSVGYTPTAKQFYAMPEWIRLGIIDFHIKKGKKTKSSVCNLVLAYSCWGSGTDYYLIKKFNSFWGKIDSHIDRNGEYLTFWRLLYCRRIVMQERNPKDWPRYGAGWSSGLAHFHRVFKVYCNS